MANIGFVTSNQFDRELVELREVVARICNFPRFEAEPPNHLKNTLKISGFLLFRVRIVISQVTLAAVVGRISEIDKNGFRMADMKISVRFWGETRPNLAPCGSKMSVSEVGVDLGISTRFVELS